MPLPFRTTVIESVARLIVVHVEYDVFVLFCALVVRTFTRAELYALMWAFSTDSVAEVCESVRQFEYFTHSACVVHESSHDSEIGFVNYECTRYCAKVHHVLRRSGRLLTKRYLHWPLR